MDLKTTYNCVQNNNNKKLIVMLAVLKIGCQLDGASCVGLSEVIRLMLVCERLPRITTSEGSEG